MKEYLNRKLGDVITLEYGKPLPNDMRDPNGKYPAYGANGEKTRTNQYLRSGPSIIVGRKGSAGEITLTEDHFWPLDVTYYVTFDTSKYDLKFLYHTLDTLDLTKLAKGVKPGINRNEVYALNIKVPPLPEQKRIVAILNEVFNALTKAKEHGKKNLQNSRDILESYLQGIFSNAVDDWEKKTLKQIAVEFGRGRSKHRPRGDLKLLGGEYPLIQTGDISNSNHWITTYSQTYNKIGLAQSKLWPMGTVCIAIVGANVAETGILNFAACFPDSVIGIVVNENIANNEYIEFLLQSFKAFLKEKGKGTARDNINLGTFENQTFPLPPLKTQKEIVSKINSMAAEIQRLENIYQQKLASLEELKKSILHKALAVNQKGQRSE